jgi:hypothetical protein
MHCLSLVTLEGGYDKACTPRSQGFGLIRPASTQPRRPAQFDREERPAWHGAPGHFTVSSPMSPRCPGMAGHSRDTSLQSPLQGLTKHHLKAPQCPGLLLPYKRAGQDPTRKQRTTGRTRAQSQTPAIQDPQHRDQHLKQSSLYSFFSL